jgi:hypothetical protein
MVQKKLVLLGSIGVIIISTFSCKNDYYKINNNNILNKQKLSEVKQNMHSDTLKMYQLITLLKKDIVNIDNKELNGKYLSDTVYGDCIFYKLNLESLYNAGRVYLLKEEIENKHILFDSSFKNTLLEFNQYKYYNNEIIISVDESDEDFESQVLYKFVMIKNRIFLKSINCSG